jgi:hypothetical protein
MKLSLDISRADVCEEWREPLRSIKEEQFLDYPGF